MDLLLRRRSTWALAFVCATRWAGAEPEPPGPTESASAESASAESALAESAPTEPAGAEPAPTEPTATEPTATEPAGAEPAGAETVAADAPVADDAAPVGEPGTTPDPASPESPRSELVTPPAPAALPPPPPAAKLPAPSRGPFGLSGPATRTLGWVTFAVSTAAGIGLVAGGIAACSGEGLDCVQGQPLIWSGAVVGLGGIPLGLSLIVRGGQLSVEGGVAHLPQRTSSSF